jgi:hypothetical protein
MSLMQTWPAAKELLGEFVLKTLRSRYAVPVIDIPSA